jgi:midasin
VRDGDWVILDELNLAPVEVLEALNRLLDDNRELYIGELNTTFRAHPRFRLFATQNPVGTYAGRKRLSRAFLNRFVIFQYVFSFCVLKMSYICFRFQHPPFLELEEIVMARCAVPPSAAKLMIEVLIQLKNSRSITGIFSASDGLMTLRLAMYLLISVDSSTHFTSTYVSSSIKCTTRLKSKD